MATAIACPPIILQFFANNGQPNAGGYITTKVGGVNHATYEDAGATTPLPNPIPLNSRGEVSNAAGASKQLFLDPGVVYTFTTFDRHGNQLNQATHVTGIFDPSAAGSLIPLADNTYDLGSSSYAWRQLYLGANHAPVLDTVTGNIGYYKRTAAELAASVTPTNYSVPPGYPKRYGAVGNGSTNDTSALTSCIAANDDINFENGATYAVTTITFPSGRHMSVKFNGAAIRGIASSATDCVVRVKSNTCTFHDYWVDLNFNMNYTCGTWWYDAVSASQFNNFFGMNHTYGRRALVYGELPGSSSTSLAQSENNIFGWRTRGIQNPFYGNHANGGLFFSCPHFVALNEEWPVSPTFNWTDARAFENVSGIVVAIGGELIKAASNLGYAADMKTTWMDGIVVETACPIKITGDAVRFDGGARMLMGRDDQPQFYIDVAATGTMQLSDVYFTRAAGTGAYSSQPIVDSSANSSFRTLMSNTQSFEWRWSLIGGDVRLVKGGVSQYDNHALSITVADSNIYILKTLPTDSLLDGSSFDRLGYTTTGWTLTNDFGGGTTVTVTSVAGPTGYLAQQVTLHATGQSLMGPGDATSLATIKSSMLRVRPGELYWMAANCNISTGTTAQLQARFYDLTGALVSDVAVADSGGIGTGSWKFVEGPLVVPATAAYMNPSVRGNVSDVRATDLRIRRAS